MMIPCFKSRQHLAYLFSFYYLIICVSFFYQMEKKKHHGLFSYAIVSFVCSLATCFFSFVFYFHLSRFILLLFGLVVYENKMSISTSTLTFSSIDFVFIFCWLSKIWAKKSGLFKYITGEKSCSADGIDYKRYCLSDWDLLLLMLVKNVEQVKWA